MRVCAAALIAGSAGAVAAGAAQAGTAARIENAHRRPVIAFGPARLINTALGSSPLRSLRTAPPLRLPAGSGHRLAALPGMSAARGAPAQAAPSPAAHAIAALVATDATNVADETPIAAADEALATAPPQAPLPAPPQSPPQFEIPLPPQAAPPPPAPSPAPAQSAQQFEIPAPAQATARPPAPSPAPAQTPQQLELPFPAQAPAQPAPQPAATVPAAAPAPKLNRTNRVLNLTAPLKDDEILLGDVDIRVSPDDSIEVSAERVVELLSRSLGDTALERLRQIAQPGVFVPLSQFAAYGLPISFNPQTFELIMMIPPEARARRSIGLADLDPNVYGTFSKPEAFSFYTNILGSVDYVHTGPSEGLGDPLFLLDSALNVRGVVLENEATFSPNGDAQFVRDGTRVVWDDLAHLNRWVGGDLLNQTAGFQASPSVAGISVSRLYAQLDPQRNLAPRGERSFTLAQASNVEVYINDREVRTIRLQPGTYNVSDFPFVQGSNDVRLVIRNDAGLTEVVSFSLFLDRTQLAPGLSEYSVYAGVRSDRPDAQLEYDTSDYVVSGFYRRGITDALTLGGNAQFDTRRWMVGGEWVWGTKLGTFGGDAAFSGGEGGEGYAVNMSLDRLVQHDNGTATSMVATLEARSERFGAIDALTPNNPFAFIAALSFNQALGETSYVSAQGRYAMGRGAQEDEWSIRGSYGRRVFYNTNLVLEAEWADRGARGDDATFRVTLVRRFGDRASARAEYDSADQRARLSYQTSHGQGVGAWNADASVDYAAQSVGLNASATYTANRADFGIAHSTAFDQTVDEISDQRTSFRFGTAVAYTGGSFAMGRPISDSFAIVRPFESLRGTRIEVQPTEDGYYASTGTLGPALYGQVSAYSPTTVTYDAPGAPPGVDIGTGALRMQAPYRSGYVVTVGSAYGVTAIGKLLDAQGDPVTLLAGKAVEIGGEGRTVEVFTNRSGTFGASGLKAGRWRIEMPGQPPMTYEVVIPETPTAVVRLGDLSPQ